MHEQYGVPLADLTTLRLGGPARRVLSAETEVEVVEALRACDAAGEPVLVLGGGSNLVAADDGFAGTAVRIATRGVRRQDAAATVSVAAGEPWDDLVAYAVEAGWAGVEALSGIPGLTGATPIQNVGAYGQEVADTLTCVRAYDRRRGEVRTFDNTECGFTYRGSAFKGDPRWVVLEVTFRLARAPLGTPIRYVELARSLGVDLGARAPLPDVREAVLALRRRKGMVLDASDPDTWSAGSFFTNPLVDPALLPPGAPSWAQPDGRVKTSAAWLIEQAGFGRGYGGASGRAALSTKHPLALTNRGGASTAELLNLAREVRCGVHERFGIELVNEPVIVGGSL